jgi:hypothetical protein
MLDEERSHKDCRWGQRVIEFQHGASLITGHQFTLLYLYQGRGIELFCQMHAAEATVDTPGRILTY